MLSTVTPVCRRGQLTTRAFAPQPPQMDEVEFDAFEEALAARPDGTWCSRTPFTRKRGKTKDGCTKGRRRLNEAAVSRFPHQPGPRPTAHARLLPAGTSRGRRRLATRSSIAPRPPCGGSRSRIGARGWFAIAVTSRSGWPRSRCRETCSARSTADRRATAPTVSSVTWDGNPRRN